MNPVNAEHKLSVINNGKMAELAYSHFSGLISIVKAELINKLTGDYRAGKVDAVLMASHVSAMCVLEDLDKRAQRAIFLGRQTEKEIADSGKPANE